MVNKRKNVFLKEKNIYIKWCFYIATLLFLFFVWWIISAVIFKTNRLIPTPLEVYEGLTQLLSTALLWHAVLNTLSKAAIGFLLAFINGLIFAFLAYKVVYVKYILEPIISIIRSFPTLAVTLILLMWYGGDTASIIIGFLIVFPIIYTTIYEAIMGIDKNLISMAKTYNVSKAQTLFGISFLAILPHIFSACLSGFTLNLKVVIAAEIISLPNNSIGLNLISARNSYEYDLMFAWVIIAVILSFVCEFLLRLLRKASLPWERYKTIFPKRERHKLNRRAK